MFRRMSIATRLAAAACLFVAPVGYGVWVEVAGFGEHIAEARLELDGAAYLDGIDGVRAALAHALIQGQAPDDAALVRRLAELRASHGGAIDAAEASREAEALLAGGDRSPARTDTRRALRRLVLTVHARSGILADPEVASFSLGDLATVRLGDLRDQIVDLDQAARRSVNGALFGGRMEMILQAIGDDVAAATGPNGRPALKTALDTAHRPLAVKGDGVLAVLESGGFDRTQVPALLDAADRLGAESRTRFTELVTARIERVDAARLRVIGISAVLTLLAFAAVVGLVRSGVIAPLRRMSAALRRLADGDMAAEVPRARFDDEVADLAAAMTRFKEKLGASRALSEAVVQSTLQVSVATDQAAVAVTQVSGGARDEMASVERLRRSFDEALAAMEQVGNLTAAGQERSQDAAKRLAESLTDIDAMAAAVRDIAGMSREINRVTLAIGKLAAHSNILSLNASIEASRAGEQGRGFAVVAGSVGSLAQQTLALAREIAALAQRSNEQIGHGLEVAAAVEQRMREVSAGIGESDRLSQSIADEVGRQRVQFAGVEAALAELSQISQANAAAAEEITATMRSLSALTDDTRRQAERVMAGRANRRRATLIDAVVEVAGRSEAVALYDLSEDGAMVASDAPCTPGTRVVLDLTAAGLRIEAETVACTEGFHYLNFLGRTLPTATVDALASAGVGRLIEATKADHRAFVGRVADALAGRSPLAAGELSTHHGCRLGRWYDNVSDEVMLALPAFRELLEPHRRLHAKGREVLTALADQRAAEARAHMVELEDLSARILDRLDRLGTEAQRAAAA